MGIKTPFICEIAPDTYAINEFGIAAEFLIIGKERALLIDTGVGLCDLPGIVSSLTKLPYDVVLTHGHGDHVGGIGHFERIYIHEADMDMVRNMDVENLKNYNRSLGEKGAFSVYDYAPEAVKEITKFPELIPVNEGDYFYLGDRTLMVLETPGHTPGSICLLDPKTKILFSGDACNINLGLTGTSVSIALKGLRKLLSIGDWYDRNYNGHIGYMGNPDCFSMPSHVPQTCVDICEAILSGTVQSREIEMFGRKVFAVKQNGVCISYIEK